MPRVSPNPRSAFSDTTRQNRAKIQGQTNSQYSVTVDPTEMTGDPSNNYATMVEGWLFPITGIDAFGLAVYRNGPGDWVQVDADTGWTLFTTSGTGTLYYRVIGNTLWLNGTIIGVASGGLVGTLPVASAFPAGSGGNKPVYAEQGGTPNLSHINVDGSNGDIYVYFATAGSTVYVGCISFLIY